MRESKLYLNFIRRYLLLFLIVSLISTCTGIFIEMQKLPHFQIIRLLEIDSSQGTIEERTKVVQEAVSLIRSANIQQDIGTSSIITVYNNSPLTLTLQVVSNEGNSSHVDLDKITHYIQGKFLFNVIGKDFYSTLYPNILLGALSGLVLGDTILLSGLLVYSYFKKY